MNSKAPAQGGAGIVGRYFHWSLQCLVLVTVACIFVPFLPSQPLGDSEASWAFGLNQAVAQGLVFGRDIIYTLGPYASVHTRVYHPGTDHLMLLGSAYLALSFALALVLLTRNSRSFLLLVLLLILSGFQFTRDPLSFCYPLLVGLYCFAQLQQDKPAAADYRWALILFLFSPFGLLLLIKGSNLVLCGAVAILVMLAMAYHRRWSWMAVVIVSICASLVLFWLLSGQPLDGLPDYLRTMVSVISGYSDAMYKYGSAREVFVYIAGAVVLLGCIACERRLSSVARLYTATLFALVLFLAFKAGFVRHDGHAVVAASTLILATLLFALAHFSRTALLGIVVSIFAWISIDSYTRNATIDSTIKRVKATYSRPLEGIELRSDGRNRLQKRFKRRVRQLQQEFEFPLWQGSSDIYSFSQSYLIASRNNWNPRPVFQSYVAYNPTLASVNRAHLEGDAPPDNLLFKVEPIDGHLPSLEDGPSWSPMLARYQPGRLERGYLHLHRKPLGSPLKSAAKALPGSGHYSFGEVIPVPDQDALLFAEIAIGKSLVGRLLALLYKPAELRLIVTLEDGVDRNYRLIPGMAEAGFLLSPLIESTVQFSRLYGDLGDLADKRVVSISIRPKGGEYQWQDSFEISFNTLKPPPAIDLDTFYPFAQEFETATDLSVSVAQQCEGNIDAINGTLPAPGHFSASNVLEVDGWLAKSAAQGQLPDAALVVLMGAGGERRFFETRRTPHRWAENHFGNPAMAQSGFKSVLDVSGLSGAYTLGLAMVDGERIQMCPQFSIAGSLSGAAAY